MPRPKKPFVIQKRSGSKSSYLLTLNTTSGLTDLICQEWYRKSFQNFPSELALFSTPKTKAAAAAAAMALIEHLKKKQEEGHVKRVKMEDVAAGDWIKKFTAIETSPRTGVNASKNRPYSPDTVETYRGYYENHIKDDPFAKLKMAEILEEDAYEFNIRLSIKQLADGRTMGGTRTYAGVIIFIRMAFKEYQRKNRRWLNPFQYIDPPVFEEKVRIGLPEDEMVKLFYPGVLVRTMELAVCACMFLSGLRRSEIFALKPCDLDWHTPKIIVRRAWQCFEKKDKRLGPPKGKKERDAPFDPVLQEAIKKLWAENGKHEFVFS